MHAVLIPVDEGERAEPLPRSLGRLTTFKVAFGKYLRRCVWPHREAPEGAERASAGVEPDLHARRSELELLVGDDRQLLLPDAQEDRRQLDTGLEGSDQGLVQRQGALVGVVGAFQFRDHAGTGRDILAVRQTSGGPQHLEDPFGPGVMLLVYRVRLQAQGRFTLGRVDFDDVHAVEGRGIVEAPEHLVAAGHLHAQALIGGLQVAPLRGGFALVRRLRWVREAHAQPRLGQQPQRRRLELQALRRQRGQHLLQGRLAVVRLDVEAGNVPQQAEALGGVRSAESNLAHGIVLNGADLLLAEAQDDRLAHAAAVRFQRWLVKPVRLLRPARLERQLHAQAADVERACVDLEVKRLPARGEGAGHADVVAIVGRAGGADEVERLLACLFAEDRLGLVQVGVESDATLLVDELAVLLRLVVAVSRDVGAHARCPSGPRPDVGRAACAVGSRHPDEYRRQPQGHELLILDAKAERLDGSLLTGEGPHFRAVGGPGGDARVDPEQLRVARPPERARDEQTGLRLQFDTLVLTRQGAARRPGAEADAAVLRIVYSYDLMQDTFARVQSADVATPQKGAAFQFDRRCRQLQS